MASSFKIWQPKYTLSPAIARGLMDIEFVRAKLAQTTLPLRVTAQLQHQARLRSTHFSTRIEGNRLTLDQAAKVVGGKKTQFHGRERDVLEVRNYWNALLRVEKWAAAKREFSENLIREIHAMVEKGLRAKPTPYRDGQNVIRDSRLGKIVYLPPEAKDVPGLMGTLTAWVRLSEKHSIPVPLTAALAHYQFVTIHPYYDGNGRTARLLATFLLQRGGYGLNGLFSLEEHHARDLEGYYRSLAVHPHHNYYEGCAEADLTPWVNYFIQTLGTVFQETLKEAASYSQKGFRTEPAELRRLDHRGRTILDLFISQAKVTTPQIARKLGLSDRMVRLLLKQWVKEGWLHLANASKRGRAYELAGALKKFVEKE
jgi:Fic family protein